MRRAGSVMSSAVAVVIALVSHASTASADVVFTSSNADGLNASVTFSIVGGNLVVTLTNTSASDVTVPSQLLTAVFFNAPGALTPVSAMLASGSSVINGPDGGGNLGGEWAYVNGLNLNGANSGISSSGLGIFGENDLFGGSDLDAPDAPNGMNYGITSAGDNLATMNNGLSDEPIIQNSVVFTLSGWDSDWDLTDITSVWFQYGTSLSEPNLGVPEPGTIALMTLGLVGFAFAARKMSWL